MRLGLALILIALAPACGSMGFTVNRGKLLSTASFDHNCPVDRIQVLAEQDDGAQGTGRYRLDVCGQERKYKRAGTLYFEAGKSGRLDSMVP